MSYVFSDVTIISICYLIHDIDTSENENIDDFIREGLQMRTFDHPNVMYLKGICWTLDEMQNSPRIAPLIVLPYMELGDLKNFLRKCRLGQVEEQVFTIPKRVISPSFVL